MAPDSEGNDEKEAVSSQPTAGETIATNRHRLTTSAGTLTSPSPSLSSCSDVPGDSLHAPPLPTLPFDMGVEILLRLPVKLLLQFRCVCKSCNFLISDPKFAKKHLRNSQTYFTRHHLILGRRDCDCDLGEFLLWDSSLPSVFNSVSTSIPESWLSYPLNNGACYVSIVGSCDDILCLDPCNDDDDNFVFVWNPRIRKFKILPPLENQLEGCTIYDFGYDHFTDNYKVIVVFCYKHDRRNWVCKTQVKVHTLGTDSWKRIQDFPSVVLANESGIFVGGAVNWLASTALRSSRVIVSLNLGKELYEEILQPNYGGGSCAYLDLGSVEGLLVHPFSR